MSADSILCLPQELTDTVIDELSDDIPALKSCALAARTFVAPTRRHIFKKIELTPPKGESSSPCQRFLELLTEGPHIVPLIEELCIVLAGTSCDVDYYDHSPGTRRPTPETSGHWMVEAAGAMALILSRLAYLTRISLVENGFVYGQRLKWNDMGQPLQSALEGVFSSPRLQAVRLRGIYFHSATQLFSLFSESTSIEEISLARVGFTSSTRFDESDPRPWRCPQLRALVLASDHLTFDSMWGYLLDGQNDLANLASLTLVVENIMMPQSMEVIAYYMPRAKCRVQTLRIRCGESLGGAKFPQSIFNPNLRFIHLSAPYLETLSSFFKSVSEESPALETITFENSATKFRPCSYTPLQDSFTAQALVHLPSLKAVEVRYMSWPASTEFAPPFSKWADWVRKSFPSLVERNLLHVVECRIPDRGLGHSFE
ncbi:hypothetical protein R3P38DRAFT_321333 [Favolaschia claudopus]|uniref:F-box domain-containing protein n=1 Tax=Favolaschia claudopus TaxID=2862362 RepID=A0AAW0CWF1_9AGAR